MQAFTPRNVAKYVVKAIVAGKTAQLTEQAITDHTQFDEDDLVVDITGTVVGWYVASKLKPYTDVMVDKTADWINARKAQKTQTDTPE